MTDKEPLPVAGYTAQSDAKIALVNEFKQDEERLLRKIDKLTWTRLNRAGIVDPVTTTPSYGDMPATLGESPLISDARKHFMLGFMLLNRAVFQPQRISLPEDENK